MAAIGMLVPAFPGQTHIAIWRVGQQLRQRGHSVQFISTRRPTNPFVHQALADDAAHCKYLWPPSLRSACHAAETIQAARSYMRRLESPGIKLRARILALTAAARELTYHIDQERIDAIFAHSCADFAHVCAIAYDLSRIKYALRLGGDPRVYGGQYVAKMQNALGVLAASDHDRRLLKDELAGRIDVPIASSSLGVDCSLFSPPAEQRREIRAGGARPILCSICRLDRGKGLHVALHAVKAVAERLPSIEYRIGGSGPEEASLRRLASGLKLDKNVSFLGTLDQSSVRDELRRSLIFLLPTIGHFEGTPVAVLEAMACGSVPIASRIGGVPGLISSNTNGVLVDPGDPDSLAAEIQTLISEPNRLQALQTSAILHVQDKHSTNAAASNVERILRLSN